MKARIIGIIAIGTLMLGACTPLQVATFLHKPVKSVSPREVKLWSEVYDKVQTSTEQIAQQQTVGFMEHAIALHNEPFLACTRGHESDTAGGYHAVSPGGTYRGAYQFDQNTWDNTARHAGLPWLAGQDPASVPGFWQDVLAENLYQWQGNAPWAGRC